MNEKIIVLNEQEVEFIRSVLKDVKLHMHLSRRATLLIDALDLKVQDKARGTLPDIAKSLAGIGSAGQ